MAGNPEDYAIKVLGDRALQFVFPGAAPAEESPLLILVEGQPGAGTSRVAARAASGRVSVSRDGLHALHPDFVAAMRHDSLGAAVANDEVVTEALLSVLGHARSQRRSLTVDAAFQSPTARIVAESFAADGFGTQLVLVGASRSESLLASTSRYLVQRRRNLPAVFTSREGHERAWNGVRELATSAEEASHLGRLTVVDREGEIAFDSRYEDPDRFDGAAVALGAAQQFPRSVMAGAEWFGELRRVTSAAQAMRETAAPVVEVLIELHELGLHEVLPALPVGARSGFAVQQERRIVEEIVRLRDLMPAPPMEPIRVDLTTPVVGGSGVDRGGISR